MKKLVIILLIALPLFLMISISFVGKIIEIWTPVAVEGIAFVNSDGDEIDTLDLNKNEVVPLLVKITPYDATNQNVTYSVLAGGGCELDQDNNLIGIEYGTSVILVVTEDGYHQAKLTVNVADLKVSSISLNHQELTLKVGETIYLQATILPMTAVNRTVIWSSDSDCVTVNQSGRITVTKYTIKPVTIFATTVDGNFVATCLITIENLLPDIAFYRIDEETPLPEGEIIVVLNNQIDLNDYIRFGNEEASIGTVTFTLITSSKHATLDGHNLTILTSGMAIQVLVTVTYQIDGVEITYQSYGRFRKN